MKLILASASPRRAEILRDAGISFTVLSSAVDETPYAGETPQQMVQRLSAAKAELVAARAVGPAILVAADTTVVLDGQLMGKPAPPKMPVKCWSFCPAAHIPSLRA